MAHQADLDMTAPPLSRDRIADLVQASTQVLAWPRMGAARRLTRPDA